MDVDAIARLICDDAQRWGDRLHGWDDSGEDVRETFRGTARKVKAALGIRVSGAVPCKFHPTLPAEGDDDG